MVLRRSYHTFLIFVIGCTLLLLLLQLLALARPTKSTIVYSSSVVGKNPDIYTMGLDGSNIRRLSQGSDPAWSPDGTKIAFRLGKSELAIMNCDGSNVQILPTEGIILHQNLDWSPDRTKIVFHAPAGGNNDIFILDLTTRTVRNLTNNPKEDEEPSWSPDSKWIVFSSNRDPKFWLPNPVGGFFLTSDLYIMDAEENNLQNITQTTIGENQPAWSPDGTKIAFTVSTHFGPRAGNHLYVMDVNGGKPRRLTNFKGDFAIHSPSWSPDSQQIIFSLWLADKGQNTNIYLINRDGMNLRQITDNIGINIFSASWFDPDLVVLSAELKTTWGVIKQKYK